MRKVFNSILKSFDRTKKNLWTIIKKKLGYKTRNFLMLIKELKKSLNIFGV